MFIDKKKDINPQQNSSIVTKEMRKTNTQVRKKYRTTTFNEDNGVFFLKTLAKHVKMSPNKTESTLPTIETNCPVTKEKQDVTVPNPETPYFSINTIVLMKINSFFL